jgi:hypothetical protein
MEAVEASSVAATAPQAQRQNRVRLVGDCAVAGAGGDVRDAVRSGALVAQEIAVRYNRNMKDTFTVIETAEDLMAELSRGRGRYAPMAYLSIDYSVLGFRGGMIAFAVSPGTVLRCLSAGLIMQTPRDGFLGEYRIVATPLGLEWYRTKVEH